MLKLNDWYYEMQGITKKNKVLMTDLKIIIQLLKVLRPKQILSDCYRENWMFPNFITYHINTYTN